MQGDLHILRGGCVYWSREEARQMHHHCGDGPFFLGVLAVALGAGILIAAIFPTGALLFLVAFLLIACGWYCCRR